MIDLHDQSIDLRIRLAAKLEIAKRNEGALRDCLGRWVSEAEPVTIWAQDHHGLYELIGLGAAHDASGAIYVHARTGMH